MKQISNASIAFMAVGALRTRRADYANAAMKRPANGITTDFIKSAMDEEDVAASPTWLPSLLFEILRHL